MRHGPVKDRLISRLGEMREGECWHYQAYVSKYGYGELSEGQAHRVAYEVFVGPIPEGMVIDHECHNEAVRQGECEGGRLCLHRRCCNPSHLKLTTQAVNIEGSVKSFHAREACPRGHLNSEWRRRSPSGQTYCLKCRAELKSRKANEDTLVKVQEYELEVGETVTTSEAAEIMGIGVCRVTQLCWSGDLESSVIKNKRRISVESIELMTEVRKVPKSKKKGSTK